MANGDHGQLTQEGLAAALQMASDQALGLAAQVDAVDALGQVADTMHGSAVSFWARLLAIRYQGNYHTGGANDANVANSMDSPSIPMCTRLQEEAA